jgi:hypothetical protein
MYFRTSPRYTLRIVGDSAVWRRSPRLVRSLPADMSHCTASVHYRTLASMTFRLFRPRIPFAFSDDIRPAMIKV